MTALDDERRKRVAFEKFVREELKHLKQQQLYANAALDELLRIAKLDEERAEAAQGGAHV